MSDTPDHWADTPTPYSAAEHMIDIVERASKYHQDRHGGLDTAALLRQLRDELRSAARQYRRIGAQ